MLTGEGKEMTRIYLSSGTWDDEASVRNNRITAGRYRDTPEDFVIFLVTFGGRQEHTPIHQTAVDWEGTAVVRVGPTSRADLGPGGQILAIDAGGDWSVRFTPR